MACGVGRTHFSFQSASPLPQLGKNPDRASVLGLAHFSPSPDWRGVLVFGGRGGGGGAAGVAGGTSHGLPEPTARRRVP